MGLIATFFIFVYKAVVHREGLSSQGWFNLQLADSNYMQLGEGGRGGGSDLCTLNLPACNFIEKVCTPHFVPSSLNAITRQCYCVLTKLKVVIIDGENTESSRTCLSRIAVMLITYMCVNSAD